MDPLTPRECQVAMLVTRGLSNKEVARQLGVGDGTLKLHVHTTSCRSLVVEYDLGDSTSHRTDRQLDMMTFVGRSVPRLENDALTHRKRLLCSRCYFRTMSARQPRRSMTHWACQAQSHNFRSRRNGFE